MQILFLKFFSSGIFFHIFAKANQLPGFSISKFSKWGGFFLIVNINASINNFSFKYICVHLDLLHTNILSKYFVCLQDVLKTSTRHASKTFLRHVFKTSCKMSSRQKIVTLKTCWRSLQDMSWRPTNICWEMFLLSCLSFEVPRFKFERSCKNYLLINSWI